MKIIKSIPKENAYFRCEEVENGNLPERTEHCIVNIFDEFEYQEMIGSAALLPNRPRICIRF